MRIALILKSIKNSFRSFRKIYLLLIVSQFISVISIFCVYGIFTSYSVKMQEVDIDSYIIGSTFNDGDMGTLKAHLPEIMDQIGSKMDYIFITGVSDDFRISMYTEYHGGKYTLADLNIKNSHVKEGRALTYEDAVNENRVIYSQFTEEHKAGDRLNIAGLEFEVVGVDEKNVDTISMPFNVCPDEVGVWLVYFNFEHLPTEKDYKVIKNTLENVFGDKVMIDEFQLKNQETIISYRTTIIISVAIGLISALNTCLLYGYIVSQRQKQMAIYGIVGASKGLRLMMNEMEIMLVDIVVVIVAFVFFRCGLQDIITKIYESSIELYNMKVYLIMMTLYVVCIFIFTIGLLIIMNKDELTDMLRRTKND